MQRYYEPNSGLALDFSGNHSLRELSLCFDLIGARNGPPAHYPSMFETLSSLLLDVLEDIALRADIVCEVLWEANVDLPRFLEMLDQVFSKVTEGDGQRQFPLRRLSIDVWYGCRNRSCPSHTSNESIPPGGWEALLPRVCSLREKGIDVSIDISHPSRDRRSVF
ncbi:hypothetical protein CC2G_001690 [Coprinopsis cinerea AmutBmut pab1-1]|nr:hypothetical protein CC2G_001690 [Coprinopsis cinerea AmutBmut pab1-1]